jgi:hypothetical protein
MSRVYARRIVTPMASLVNVGVSNTFSYSHNEPIEPQMATLPAHHADDDRVPVLVSTCTSQLPANVLV